MPPNLSTLDGDNDKGRSTASAPSGFERLANYLKANVTVHYADLVLLLCCFISGLCDSGTFNAWTCFVNMQTGNTIFLALGASGQPASKPYGWLRSLVSIIAFIIGSCFFTIFARNFGSHRRGTLSISFFIQALCLVIAAALVQSGVVPQTVENDESMIILVPLIFLGFQAGGQVGASDILGYKEIPTTVLTSVYYGLASDAQVITAGWKENPRRNRRVAAVSLLLLGAIAGGWLTKSSGGVPSVLWIAAGLKVGIAGAWLGWEEEK